MPAVRAIGILFLALAAGCATPREAPPRIVMQTGPVIADPGPAGPIRVETITAAPPRSEAIDIEPMLVAPAPPAKSQSAPVAKSAAKVSAAPMPSKSEAPPPASKASGPPLDVSGLKARLRDTPAIGMFTKLALKNQVDDLLQQFRVHYLTEPKTSVASLREPFDRLVVKVLALIQDGDPSLARTLSESREAIWGILADREKFNAAT